MVPPEVPDQVADLHDLARVEPDGRLVEDEDLRLVDERAGEADPLAVPLREVRRSASFATSSTKHFSSASPTRAPTSRRGTPQSSARYFTNSATRISG